MVTSAIYVWAVIVGNGGCAEVVGGILTAGRIDDAIRGTVNVDTAVEIAVDLLANGAVSFECVVRIAVCVVVIFVDCVNVSDSNTAVEEITVLEASQESIGMGRRALRAYNVDAASDVIGVIKEIDVSSIVGIRA